MKFSEKDAGTVCVCTGCMLCSFDVIGQCAFLAAKIFCVGQKLYAVIKML